MKSYEQDEKFKSKLFSQIPLTFLHQIHLVCYKTQSENSISSLWKAANSYFNSKLLQQVMFLKKLKFKFVKYIAKVQML